MAGSGDQHPNETQAHEAIYSGFTQMLKIGTIATVLATALVIFLIAS